MAELTVGTCQPECHLLVLLWMVATIQNARAPSSAHPEHQPGVHSWMEAEEAILGLLPPLAASQARCLCSLHPGHLVRVSFIALTTLDFSSSELLYFSLKDYHLKVFKDN